MQGEGNKPYLHQAMGSSHHLAKDEFAPSRPICFGRLSKLRRAFCRSGCTSDGVFCRQEQPRDKSALSATCHTSLTGEPSNPASQPESSVLSHASYTSVKGVRVNILMGVALTLHMPLGYMPVVSN